MRSPRHSNAIGTAGAVHLVRVALLVLMLSAGVMLIAAAAGPSRAPAHPSDAGIRLPPPRVVPNDNRHSAGVLRGDTLFVRLVLREGEWFPESDTGSSIVVTALSEEGQPPTIPAPLIRVREGTFIDVTLRNDIAGRKAESHGLVTHPQPEPAGVHIGAGDSMHVRFPAGAAGTYSYDATPADSAPGELRDTPVGALVVDPPQGSPPDRVIVINAWTQPAADTLHYHEVFTFNGRSWPHTERITAQVGDTLRWRVVNGTDDLHPLHLHGHYFSLTNSGTGLIDSLIPLGRRKLVVTEPMSAYQTMALEWVAQTAGNWLFHCHLTFHVDPAYSGLNVPAYPENEPPPGHTTHEQSHMSGLVLGIRVTPRPGDREVAGATTDQYRLLVQEGQRRGRSPHARGFVLQRGATPAADSIEIPGTTLLFTRGKPADVRVVNHLPEPASVHWHGLEVESYSDGAPGWSGVGTRIATSIAPGDSFTAHLALRRAGTFMYHTHLNDMEQLTSGLYGALIVLEPGQRFDPAHDHVYVGSWDGREDPPHLLVNGDSVTSPSLELKVGEKQRFRLIGIGVVSGGRFSLSRDSTFEKWQLVAKDGADVSAPMSEPLIDANQRVMAGETFDFKWTPRQAGVYILRARAVKDAIPWTQRVVVR